MSRVTSSSSTGTVSIQDTNGNPITSTDGALNVTVSGSVGVSYTLIPTYNEITNVASGIESTIVTYTVPLTNSFFLTKILTSGTDVAEFRLYLNSTIIDKRYTSFTEYNTKFEFDVASQATGLKLNAGDVLVVTAIQNRADTCNFNGNILIIEEA